MMSKAMRSINPISYARGLSLIELMISLALSSVLILGVFTIYLDSKKTDQLGASLSRIQEAGRFAQTFMAKDIRMAGYQGCADPTAINLTIIANNPPTTNFGGSGLRGFEVDDATWADGTEFDGSAIESRARIGTDVIAIQKASTENTQLTGNMGVVNANVQITANPMGFQQNDVVLISDCEYADLFRITNTPNDAGGRLTLAHSNATNTTNFLSKAYDESAKVMRFESTVYFVADTGRDNSLGQPVYALYRQTDNMLAAGTSFNIEELIEGVENMQILYGQRLPTGNLRYVTADDASLDMAEVVSVRVGLLISSQGKAQDGTDTLTYTLPGASISPEGTAGATSTHAADSRVRRTFLSTINLRNRD